jgi:hypothetical protein
MRFLKNQDILNSAFITNMQSIAVDNFGDIIKLPNINFKRDGSGVLVEEKIYATF